MQKGNGENFAPFTLYLFILFFVLNPCTFCTCVIVLSYGPRHKKTSLWGFANNTGADQPARLCSLISAFVVCFLDSIICSLATREISIFKLVSVLEDAGLNLTLSETRDRFGCVGGHIILGTIYFICPYHSVCVFYLPIYIFSVIKSFHNPRSNGYTVV